MVTHEDHLFEVQCECGTRFNPFLGDFPPPDTEPKLMNENPAEMAMGQPANFQESSVVFQELRDFGESLVPGGASVAPTPAPIAVKTAAPRATAPVSRPVVDSALSQDCLMTAGDSLPGYEIQGFLPPLSVAADLDLNGSNPLKPAFELLWTQAKSSGANGVLALKWSLTPDASKVILSGTPVRCQKGQ